MKFREDFKTHFGGLKEAVSKISGAHIEPGTCISFCGQNPGETDEYTIQRRLNIEDDKDIFEVLLQDTIQLFSQLSLRKTHRRSSTQSK